MTSLNRNTISLAYLLLCLFFTSSSARSFIRQSTEDFNTTLQQDIGAKPIQKLDVAQYLHESQEILSSDYKVSASNAVTGLRDRPPSTYSLTIESYSFTSSIKGGYQTRPFAAGGYNWTLVVYLNGNSGDGGSGYISLYLAIDDSTPIPAGQEVSADIRFYMFNKRESKYFTIQDTDVWHFSTFNKVLGFPHVLSIDTFKDAYVFDADICRFGVDVTIPSFYKQSEDFSVTKNFPNPIFTWAIQGFSKLHEYKYQSDTVAIGGRKWNIVVVPNGEGPVTGKFLTMYLFTNWNEIFKPYEKIYVRAKLRVLNQLHHNNVELPLNNWYPGPGFGWGYYQFISISDLKDSAKGFVVNDVLMVQVEMETISSTKFIP